MNKRTRLFGCFILPLTLFFLLLIFIGWKGYRLFTIAQSLRQTQTRITEMSNQGDWMTLQSEEVKAIVLTTRQDILSLKSEVGPFIWLTPAFSWLPKVGTYMPQADTYLQLAESASAIGESLVPIIEPGMDILQGKTQTNPFPAILQLLETEKTSLEAASEELTQLMASVETLEAPGVQLPTELVENLPLLKKWLPIGEQGLLLAQLLPELMGQNGARSYLVLAQNEDELRPTGGYISGVGLMQVNNGEIVNMEFRSADGIDDLENLEKYDYPPGALVEFMNLQYFLFRDANFWADFPTSAENALDLYTRAQTNTPKLDGVIAFDQRFVQLIISALGTVYVEELGQEVDKNTVIQIMRDSWGTGETNVSGEWWNNRKSFMGALARSAQDRLINDPANVSITTLLDALNEATRGKHLQLYLLNEGGQKLIKALDWDGEFFISPNQDSLFVLDTNMGFNKVNTVIDRTIFYQLTLSDSGTHTANLSINYTHKGAVSAEPCNPITPYVGNLQYEDLVQTCFYNYQRIYTGPYAQLLNASSHPVPGEWMLTGMPWDGAGKVLTSTTELTTFDNYMVVNRGSSLNATYQYTLQNNILTQIDGTTQYQLTLFKQAGMRPHSVTVVVDLPASVKETKAIPEPTRVNNRSLVFEFILDRDVTLQINYR